MRGKTLACSLVVVGSLWLGQWDDKPSGYSGKTGYPAANYSFLGAGGGSSSIYADATACWSFNDPTDLGNDDCTDTYDLTAVNTPTATGGALGYSADFTAASSEYATRAKITNKGEDRSICAWGQTQSTWTGHGIYSQASLPSSGTPSWFVSVRTGNALSLYQNGGYSDGSTAVGTGRQFICYTYDHSDTGAQVVYLNANSEITKSAVDDANADDNLFIGNSFNGYWDDAIGPVMYWNIPIAPAVVTSLYNSGKGKTCSDLTAAEQVNLVSCWDMSEDGGPYADSVGSNTLTAVNTPTRAAGLVERSDSGMSVNLVAASGQKLTYSTGPWGSGSLSLTLWYFTDGTKTDFTAPFVSGGAGNLDSPLQVYHDSTAITADCALNGGTKLTTTDSLIKNAWTNLVVWYDASDGKCRLVQNDGTVQVSAATQASDFIKADDLAIGSWNYGSYQGALDMYALFQLALTSDQITSLYNSGAGTFYAAYWDALFNDGLRFAWSERPEQRRIYVR